MDWVVTVVGLTGFVLAGRKVWWSWYVNLFCQILWVVYALTTQQYAFLVSAAVYSVVFGQNAIKWTKEHRNATPIVLQPSKDSLHSRRGNQLSD